MDKLKNPSKLSESEFLITLETMQALDEIPFLYLEKSMNNFLYWCIKNANRKKIIPGNLTKFMPFLYERLLLLEL